MVFRISHAHECDLDDNSELLFAPRQLAGRSPAVFCIWKGSSHLRPWTRRRHSVLPNCYWLILLAGDVESNPGPTKYPCTACNKAVRNNQRGIFCSRCEKWTHASCGGVSPAEYQRLGEQEDDSWFCTGCMMAELPFFNASRNGCDEEECASFGNQSLVELAREAEHSGHSRQNEGGLVVSHLNIRSILPKHDELQVFMENFTKASVFGLSESWLDEDVLDAELVMKTPSNSLY